MTLHLPSTTNPSQPLCGRVLSRNQPLTLRDQRTMVTSSRVENTAMDAGFALASIKPVKLCRHCQRSAGLLPPITRSGRDIEGEPEEPDYEMTQDEFIAGMQLEMDEMEEDEE